MSRGVFLVPMIWILRTEFYLQVIIQCEPRGWQNPQLNILTKWNPHSDNPHYMVGKEYVSIQWDFVRSNEKKRSRSFYYDRRSIS